MVLYVYSKCSTCKEAVRFLKECGIEMEVREITITPPSMQELRRMLDFQRGNLKKLFNTSGNLYREMQLADQLNDLSMEDALKLLASHGMLVKRPFLLENSYGLLGFNKAEWTSRLCSKVG